MQYKVSPDTAHVRTIGRTLYKNDTLYLGYSCTAAEFTFNGTHLTAEITTDWQLDEPWQAMFQGQAAIFIDDKMVRRFPIESGTNSYDIYSAESPRQVKIKIMKMSENAFGKMGIVSLSGDGEIRPAKPCCTRRMEFVGDSITCGFGIEGVFGRDNFTTAQENPWETYAAETARYFGAEFHLVSWTSIGVISNSVKPDVDEPDTGWLMPDLYDYTDRGVEGWLGVPDEDKEIWDNRRFAPHVIVVNLGTNDKDYTRGVPRREAAFEQGYKEFIAKIRRKNPDAVIICALGAMGQQLCLQVESAVRSLGDDRIYSMRFEVQKEENGIGAEEHPSMKTHKIMAQELEKVISSITGWQQTNI